MEIEIVLVQGRSTTNKWRYEEDTEQGQLPVLGTIYVRKEVVEEMDNPGILLITMRSGD